jgi:hypothetical protein
MEDFNPGSVRNRVIGTGQMISELLATPNSLGYAFWGVSNWKNATDATKYLTVDGVDPLFSTYTDGLLPTAPDELSKINFAHINDGTYPIWSLLRFVCTTSCTGAHALSTAAQTFVSLGDKPLPEPDFLPYTSLKVERSHFTPPGIGFTGVLQNGVCLTTTTEVGGDVGGVVIPCYADASYEVDYDDTYVPYKALPYNEFTGRRR